MLDDYFVNLVLSVIKKTTLLSIAPIKARLFSGNTNITQTVFGVDSIPLNTLTKFSGTDNIINSQNGSNITTVVLSNANPISIGVALSSYYGVVEFRILDKDNKIINSKEQFIAIEQGATYRIPSRFLEIGISNATQILENFLLDYLVSSSPNTIYNSPTSTANNDPTKWKLVGGGTEIRAIQKSLFGLLEQNIIGQLELKYGEAWVFISQNLLSFSDLKILRSNEQNNSTLPWFQLKSAVTTQFFAPEQRIEFYNNSLAWVYEPEIIKIDTVILPEDPNSLVSIGFDGTLEDFSRTVIERSYEAVYSGDHKLFKTQSILFNTNNILYYDNFVLPQVFTLQFFVRFDISPASRNIVFLKN
ncbi:MAG: hypothetical protein CV045_02970 [Cyanobacteria bacterium M5B4]|nr:MAG: hypothetical protein CV045_02970 [Cyanobacteria bacterium M5B4]